MSIIGRRSALLAMLAALCLAIAACGSDESSSGESGSSSGADTASVPEPQTTPPTKIHITEPLKAPPSKGKTLFWLRCELPICGLITEGLEEGTQTAGWKLESQVYKAAEVGAALESAMQRKPDAIAITGNPSAAIKPQLAAAAKAGIPVVTCSPGPEQPSPTTYQAICSRTTYPQGQDFAYYAIKDSGGKANIVYATISSFAVLGTALKGLEDAVKEHCGECTTDVLDTTVEDLGAGQIGSKVVAYLQSHPDVNYIVFAFSDLAAGVPDALKAAGLTDKVKIMGNAGAEAQMASVAKGAPEIWMAYPSLYEAWEMVDAAIRLVDEGKLPEGYQKNIDSLPTYLVETAEDAKELAPTYVWPGPEGYQEQFKELWKLN